MENKFNTASRVSLLNGQDKDTEKPQKYHVEIPKNTDLNSIDNIFPEPIVEDQKRFGDEVYQNLPDILKEACKVLTDRIEKEVFLIGALGVISGLLPNVKGVYDGKEYESNLYCYILSKYGTGKGSLSLCFLLGQSIHRKKKEKTDEAVKTYKSDMIRYKKELKKFNTNNTDNDNPPVEPEPPPQDMLYIPANSSKTGMYQVLADSNARGIIFETEGDSLADAISKDYGNFSDGLRKAYHHERISYYRRRDNEHVEVEEPYLSVILSSTFDQLRNLIQTVENGLYSRFLFYELEPNPEFKDVFDESKKVYRKFFLELGNRIEDIYNYLIDLESPIYFELQTHQKQQFLELFQSLKDEMREIVSEELDGTINRLGLITFRIAMLFTTLRSFEEGQVPSKIICQDIDFENAISIVKTLKIHALSVYYKLSQFQSKSNERNLKKIEDAENLKRCIDLRNKGVSIGNIALEVFGDIKYKSKVHYWINGR